MTVNKNKRLKVLLQCEHFLFVVLLSSINIKSRLTTELKLRFEWPNNHEQVQCATDKYIINMLMIIILLIVLLLLANSFNFFDGTANGKFERVLFCCIETIY